jgi:hypothetical protein
LFFQDSGIGGKMKRAMLALGVACGLVPSASADSFGNRTRDLKFASAVLIEGHGGSAYRSEIPGSQVNNGPLNAFDLVNYEVFSAGSDGKVQMASDAGGSLRAVLASAVRFRKGGAILWQGPRH